MAFMQKIDENELLDEVPIEEKDEAQRAAKLDGRVRVRKRRPSVDLLSRIGIHLDERREDVDDD